MIAQNAFLQSGTPLALSTYLDTDIIQWTRPSHFAFCILSMGRPGNEARRYIYIQLLKLDSLFPSIPDGDWHEAAPQSVDH